jgi:hypothetical protein
VTVTDVDQAAASVTVVFTGEAATALARDDNLDGLVAAVEDPHRAAAHRSCVTAPGWE